MWLLQVKPIWDFSNNPKNTENSEVVYIGSVYINAVTELWKIKDYVYIHFIYRN